MKIKNPIPYLFYALFLITPLFFYHNTSELFEFNKMVLVYGFTILIATIWVLLMISNKRVLFCRTILGIPLLIFIFSQFVSTLFSIDKRISLLGYYSRFNGGLLSLISYTVLYFAFNSTMDKEKTINLLKITLFSSIVVSLWGILEHYGISPSCILFTGQANTECWVQDVKTRVFATIGQPNWLAAFTVAIIPFSWYMTIKNKTFGKRWFFYLFTYLLLYLVLLFTKSRSGLLAFFIITPIFWILSYLSLLKEKRKFLTTFLAVTSIVALTTLFFGTPLTPSLEEIVFKKEKQTQSTKTVDSVMDKGGTESGEIRKIVWKGALEIFRNYPLFGTGVETFALSYYQVRPKEHNLVSEWDYLYNKAHNEFLNIAANTGAFGILSYLFVIILFLSRFKESIKKGEVFLFAILCSYTSLLVTNFFGFSVVLTALLFFLLPAFYFSFENKKIDYDLNLSNFSFIQKISSFLSIIVALYLFFSLINYWRADYFYNRARILAAEEDYKTLRQAKEYILKSLKISKNETVYLDELANIEANLIILSPDNKERENSIRNIFLIDSKINNLSPKNPNLLRSQATRFIKLSSLDQNFLFLAKETLIKANKLAPTEPKLLYNLALVLAKMNNTDEAIQTLQKTVLLKPDYRNAHFALGLLYLDRGEKEKAKDEFLFILEKIDPKDPQAKEELQKIK